MDKELEVYINKLAKLYDSDGKLIQYPSKRSMRIIALVKIAQKFDMNRKYNEKEVNEIIKGSIAFGDIELVRREMFQYKFLGRLRDGSEYWVEQNWREVYGEYLYEN